MTGHDQPAATKPRGTSISFVQRSLLRPWRVERIVQEFDGRRWVVVSRVRVRHAR